MQNLYRQPSMQAVGPVNAAGVAPSGRFTADGRAIYNTPRELGYRPPAPVDSNGMTYEQRRAVQYGQAGADPRQQALYNANLAGRSNAIAQATEAYNNQYTDPGDRMRNQHLLNQQLTGIRNQNQNFNYSPALQGMSNDALNGMAGQQEQQRQGVAAQAAARQQGETANFYRDNPLALKSQIEQTQQDMAGGGSKMYGGNYLQSRLNALQGYQGGMNQPMSAPRTVSMAGGGSVTYGGTPITAQASANDMSAMARQGNYQQNVARGMKYPSWYAPMMAEANRSYYGNQGGPTPYLDQGLSEYGGLQGAIRHFNAYRR
jgi:hypothetical protein